MPPHFGTRQIVRPAIHAPHAPSNRWIEHNPIGSIPPITRHSVRGTRPGFSSVLAAKQSNVRSRNELAVVIERIEVIAIRSRYVEARAGPAAILGFPGVNRIPSCAAVRGLHS